MFDVRDAVDGTGDNGRESEGRWQVCSWNTGGRCVQLRNHSPGNTVSQWAILCLR